MTKPQAVSRADSIDTPILIYVLYLSAVILFIPAVAGVIWAYAEKSNSSEWLQTHYTYMIQTFAKGFLYLFVAVVLTLVTMIPFLFVAPVWAWWAYRAGRGLMLVYRREEIPNPESWFL
jgi:uncharacterized membrane protein